MINALRLRNWMKRIQYHEALLPVPPGSHLSGFKPTAPANLVSYAIKGRFELRAMERPVPIGWPTRCLVDDQQALVS